MDLLGILKDSVRLVHDKPKVFVPRGITTALYSILTLYSIWLAVDAYQLTDPKMLSSFMWKSLILFALTPFIYFIDILSYAMYPSIVADYQSDRPINLKRALIESIKAWRVVLVLSMVLFIVLLLVASTAAFSFYLTLLSGNMLFIPLILSLILLMMLFFAVIMFFVVPSAILDGKNVAESFKSSVELGLKHKGDLIKLNMFFLGLILITIALAFAFKVNYVISAASIAFFILVRIVEAVIYTYMSVTNPMAYIHLTVNKNSSK